MESPAQPNASAPEPRLVPGQVIQVRTHDIGFGGEGVGRLNDLVVFIPFVMVGELVEAEVLEVKKQFARAKLLQVLEPNPDRVVPACPYFGTCGGCQYQHIPYPEQLRIKHKQLVDLFQRVGQLPDPPIQPVIANPRSYGYRNRIMVRSQWNRTTKSMVVGFLRYDSRLVVDVEECKIAEPILNEDLLKVRANPPPKGGIKATLRLMPEGWVLPKDSFFQTNFHLLPALVDTVRQAMKQSGVRHLIDVYCGVGFFSLETADLVQSFAGVELDKMAIKAARENAAQRHCRNGDFVAGSAEDWLPALIQRFPAGQTAVILDPPRKGCDANSLALLRDIRPHQIIYVSCHPATLARDIKALTEGGAYQLSQVTPLDMFPQTQHIECVADLRAVS